VGFGASTRRLGDVTVVDVRGRFTLMEGQAVHDLLLDLFREGQRKVLLNFREVAYLDSSGLGELVRALYTSRKHDAQLKVVDLTQRVSEVLKVTNLLTTLAEYSSEQAAVRSFLHGD
jgi:anti-sigma B factor antagonist